MLLTFIHPLWCANPFTFNNTNALEPEIDLMMYLMFNLS